MNYSKLLISCALTAMVFGAKAANIEPDVRTGQLDNGLTYYIQYNNNPSGMADFFLAQKVGSVNEAENQRGLAHFLEHMCFNGTTHFPGKSMIEYLESIGVKFGANLNAYTSTDETVYNICKVPTARESAVDSCLLVLHDWCSEITLDPKEIDAERGIIVNEWRQRNSAANRMLEKASPKLYGGTAYGERLPIGLMSVVENFRPATLRSFYNKWYIPVNQAVIVVGDVDVDRTEQVIKGMFGAMPASRIKGSSKAELEEVPVAESLTCVVESDPEQGVGQLSLFFRLPQTPDGLEESARYKAVSDFAGSLLAARFEPIENSADCPHTNLGIGEVKYLMARGEPVLTLRGTVRAGREADAVATWYGEVVRGIQHGFSDAELAKARKSFLGSVDAQEKHSANPNSSYLARTIVRHFLDGGNTVETNDYLDLLRAEAYKVTSDDVVAYLKSAAGDAPAGSVILYYRPADGRSDKEVQKALADRFEATRTSQFEPFVMPAYAEHLMTVLPSGGSITASDTIPVLGARSYTLSNGIKVVAKRTDFKNDQIYVRAYSPGGLSLVYTDDKAPTLRCINELMAEMKAGGLSQYEIRNILADKDATVSFAIGNTEEGLEIATTPRDMEDAFQLMYLRATAAQPDSAAFRNFVEGQRSLVQRRKVNPAQAMGDSIHYTIYNRHPLAARQTSESVNQIDMGTALDAFRDRYADMGDFTFMIVGDFNPDSLEMCLSRYVATLPSSGRVEEARDFGYKYTPRSYDLRFSQKMANPQANVYTFLSGPAEYTLSDMLNATVFGNLLRNRLRDDLREKRGWTYSSRTHCAINNNVSPGEGAQMMMPSNIKVTPGKEFETLDIVYQTIDQLCDPANITDEEIAAIREFLIKNHAEAKVDNAYWLRIIKSYLRDGMDMETTYDDEVSRITPQSVADLGRRVVRPANRASIIMSAEQAQ